MTRGPVFWIVLLAISAACGVATMRHMDRLFPILDVDVRMTRDAAIAQARKLNEALKLSPAKLERAAAGFSGDPMAQTFIEQEGGGPAALRPLLAEGEHVLYTWRGRLFEPGVTNEVSVYFTPAGRPYGFRARVPEAQAGAALEQDAARAIAVERARADWSVDLAKYKPVAASTFKRTGGRVDHEFRYERLDAPIGEGKLLLSLVVSGDRLSALQRAVQVPEAFARRYQERRSANNTISAMGSVVMLLLYMLGGCLFGSIWLVRRGAWQWKPAAVLAAFIAALGSLAVLDSIPSSWLFYDTAVSAQTHYGKAIGAALGSFVMWWSVLLATIAAGEGLGRVAFGNHPYLWKAWAPRVGATRAMVGRTLGGYAWIGIELGFVAAFYYVAHHYFGWWSPGELLIDPNILSHSQPWIAPVAAAMRAGVWEEFLFRAVPLAGAALLGRHFGREKLFIGVALVLQAVVFGCVHANYPQEPSFARPVELFLPSLVWGFVYLRFGILPGILMHFGFDLALMSTPLWVADAPGIGFDRFMVVAFALLPLAVVVWRVARSRGLTELGAVDLNASAPLQAPIWRPSAAPEAAQPAVSLSRGATAALLVLGMIGAVGWVMRLATPPDAPGFSVGRDTAVRIAEEAIAKQGVTLGPEWKRMAKSEGPRDQEPHHFVWQNGGKEAFAALLGNHLPPPVWAIRFARFQGDVDVADRAEAWFVFIAGDGQVRAVHHRFPEARAGARLTREQAGNLVYEYVRNWLGVDPAQLKLVSGRSTNRPDRLDWEFIYSDPSRKVPAGGAAYVQVDLAGDQVAARGRYVFVPEAWARERKAKKDLSTLITGSAATAIFVVMATVVVLGIRRFAKHEFSKRAAIVGALAAFVVVGMQKLLGFEATMAESYDTAQPLTQQYVRDALLTLALASTAALLSAMFAGVGVRFASRAAPTAPSRFALWRDALALALFTVGAGTFLRLMAPSSGPRIPSVRDAGSHPVVGSLFDALDFLMLVTAVVTFAAVLGARSGWRAWLTALVFVAAGVILGARSPDFTPLTVLAAALVGAVSYWIYRRFVLHRLDLLPPLVACITILSAVQVLVRPAFPGAMAGALLGMASLAAGYALWQWLVRKDRA